MPQAWGWRGAAWARVGAPLGLGQEGTESSMVCPPLLCLGKPGVRILLLPFQAWGSKPNFGGAGHLSIAATKENCKLSLNEK